jgi:hypothetical protein
MCDAVQIARESVHQTAPGAFGQGQLQTDELTHVVESFGYQLARSERLSGRLLERARKQRRRPSAERLATMSRGNQGCRLPLSDTPDPASHDRIPGHAPRAGPARFDAEKEACRRAGMRKNPCQDSSAPPCGWQHGPRAVECPHSRALTVSPPLFYRGIFGSRRLLLRLLQEHRGCCATTANRRGRKLRLFALTTDSETITARRRR